MSGKHQVAIFSVSVALACIVAVNEWPQYLVPIEMAVYTVLIFGAVLMGLWSDRHRSRFWIGLLTILILHSIFLYLIRSTFPLKTFLFIIPIAVAEGSILLIVMLKILEDRDRGNVDVHDR